MNQYSRKMETSKEARTVRREKQVILHEFYEEIKGLLHNSGIIKH